MAADLLAVEVQEAQVDPMVDQVVAGMFHPKDATSHCRLVRQGSLEAVPKCPCLVV